MYYLIVSFNKISTQGQAIEQPFEVSYPGAYLKFRHT